jgi:hypothetical protein
MYMFDTYIHITEVVSYIFISKTKNDYKTHAVYLARQTEEFHVFCRMNVTKDWLMNWDCFMGVL